MSIIAGAVLAQGDRHAAALDRGDAVHGHICTIAVQHQTGSCRLTHTELWQVIAHMFKSAPQALSLLRPATLQAVFKSAVLAMPVRCRPDERMRAP